MGNGSDNLPVGPGFLGFMAVFVLAVALWFLMRNMNARMRRMAYRERDRIEQEDREHAGTGAEPAAPDVTDDAPGTSQSGRGGFARDAHDRPPGGGGAAPQG